MSESVRQLSPRKKAMNAIKLPARVRRAKTVDDEVITAAAISFDVCNHFIKASERASGIGDMCVMSLASRVPPSLDYELLIEWGAKNWDQPRGHVTYDNETRI